MIAIQITLENCWPWPLLLLNISTAWISCKRDARIWPFKKIIFNNLRLGTSFFFWKNNAIIWKLFSFNYSPYTHRWTEGKGKMFVSQLETGLSIQPAWNHLSSSTLCFVYKWIHPMLIHDENSKTLGRQENFFNLKKTIY